MRSLLPYAQLVRLPNTFTVMADILVGALATGMWMTRWHVLLCLLGASICLYWSGMVWNDYFDVNQDRRERPDRPLASGRVSLRTAYWLAWILMAAGLLLALAAGFRFYKDRGEWGREYRPIVIACELAVAIYLYDGVLKATIAGPVMMGLCRSLNILLGLSIMSGVLPFWGWLMALVIGIYVAGVTWFARTEATTSNQSVLIGAGVTMLAGLFLALTVPALIVAMPGESVPSLFFPFVLAGFGLYLGAAIIVAVRRPEPKFVQPVIKKAIMGLIVLDALLASAFI